jgi:pyridoxal phosphate enzyme (YggS family)
MSDEHLLAIPENISSIKEQITAACKAVNRNPNSVKLVAVSKTKPDSYIQKALESGQLDFGENKIQELEGKMDRLPDNAIWHMVGALQSNKIKYMIDKVHWIHSVPKLKTLKEIEKRASAIDREINCLIQVNISDEDQKSGCSPDDLPELLTAASNMKFAKVRGLMGIATNTDDEAILRAEFGLLRKLKEDAAKDFSEHLSITELSMGMTNDLAIAIAEGSTMVRIGTAIFGGRNY